jgi:general stress protein 26
MPDTAVIAAKFWKALKSDRTVLLGLPEAEGGHARPMTALFEGDGGGPLWVFTSKDNGLVEKLAGGSGAPASLGFASKGHDVWASMTGRLSISQDRAVIDRLWNPWVAAWYEGKDDPKLTLLRFDPEHAEVWLDAHSLLAGVKLLLGRDPKEDYKDKVAEIPVG